MAKQRKSDEQLIEDWQADRDREECFQRLFRRYRTAIANFYRKRRFSDEESRDLTQETFVRVYRGMQTFRHSASFKTWIYRIARNLWKNTLRDRQALKRAVEEVSLDALVGAEGEVPAQVECHLAAAGGGAGPLANILVDERYRQLKDTLAELPKDQQRLVLCRVDQELKVREIAEVMKMPEGTVKSQLARARKALKEKLGQRYPDVEF